MNHNLLMKNQYMKQMLTLIIKEDSRDRHLTSNSQGPCLKTTKIRSKVIALDKEIRAQTFSLISEGTSNSKMQINLQISAISLMTYLR